MLYHFVFVALHNELVLARYLNHLYDSDMCSILIPNERLSQASKTLCFEGPVLLSHDCRYNT